MALVAGEQTVNKVLTDIIEFINTDQAAIVQDSDQFDQVLAILELIPVYYDEYLLTDLELLKSSLNAAIMLAQGEYGTLNDQREVVHPIQPVAFEQIVHIASNLTNLVATSDFTDKPWDLSGRLVSSLYS